MPAIARDLNNILIDRIAAMVAAVFGLTCRTATAHRMFAFTFVRHDLPPCNLTITEPWGRDADHPYQVPRPDIQIITPSNRPVAKFLIQISRVNDSKYQPNILDSAEIRRQLAVLDNKSLPNSMPSSVDAKGAADFLKRSDQSPPFSPLGRAILINPSN